MSKFINTYRELSSSQAISLRNKIRHYTLNLLGSKNLVEKRLPEKSVLFLYFHSFFPDTIDNFRSILSEVQRNYTFISYSDAVSKVSNGTIDQRYACISSDDGFKNFVQASKLFDEMDIKGMVFVNPSIIGETNFQKINKHCTEKLHSPPQEFMDWDDCHLILKNGHEIGNHTFSHVNLVDCSTEELDREIVESKSILEEKLGKIDHFAYPYGERKFINHNAANIVLKAGHKSIASAIRGQHTKSIDLSKTMILREQIESFYPLEHACYFIQNNKRRNSSIL